MWTGKMVRTELNMLSALHGIGYIQLDPNVLENSQILIPARQREQVDWETVNRIVAQNKDFAHFIEQVANYYKTGRTNHREWLIS